MEKGGCLGGGVGRRVGAWKGRRRVDAWRLEGGRRVGAWRGRREEGGCLKGEGGRKVGGWRGKKEEGG